MLRDPHFKPGGVVMGVVIITTVFTDVDRIILSSSYGKI